jgi:hypothetical protein
MAAEAGAAHEVRSPDGKIAIAIHTDAPLGYSITVDGKPALLRSRLGLELADNVRLGEKPVVQSEERKSADIALITPAGPIAPGGGSFRVPAARCRRATGVHGGHNAWCLQAADNGHPSVLCRDGGVCDQRTPAQNGSRHKRAADK